MLFSFPTVEEFESYANEVLPPPTSSFYLPPRVMVIV